MFDTLVFVGRMQPFHNGHKAVIDKALDNAREVVIVLGSAFQPRSIKNPFTFKERYEMIMDHYKQVMGENSYLNVMKRIKVVGVMDYPYDDNAWVSAVQNEVNRVKTGKKVGLIGHSKDHTSYYLKIFPDWRDHIEVDNVDGINATDIRKAWLNMGAGSKAIMYPVPETTGKFMYNMSLSDTFIDLRNENYDIDFYKEQWSNTPYKPTFVTTDAVLTQSGYILLIKRGGFPFKDKWALPGGYIAQGKTVVDNMIKELREETCVKIPEKILKGSIRATQVFDDPERDPRGRTITHGFHVDLGFPLEKLPKVKGADDAAEAKWFHLSDVKSDMMAFDHYHIIKHFIPTY